MMANQDEIKVFNDPIHGHIDMPPLCVRIIDTEQFQRLRYIKQLGCCYLVYPGATHNRFEHSLGVSHLAGTFCRTLQQRQPELEITDKDVLCVQIAGLCHDLGHGPFSHMFEHFIKAVKKSSSWTHEKASVDMFDHLIEANQLKDVFKKMGGLVDKDITFIKELIFGSLVEKKKDGWGYKGRPKEKSFLYEIIANKRTGIDVDKWDYFLRDSHNLGIPCSFDCHRLMKFSRVIVVDGEKQICARDKEVVNLYDMFHTRYLLHQRACKHKVTMIIETMIVEALVKANDHFLIKGKNGDEFKMSKAISDMVAYTKLTDDITLEILRSGDSDLKESQDILKRVQKRQLYKFIGEAQPPDGDILEKKSIPKWKKEIVSALDPDDLGPPLTEDQLDIHLVEFTYGMKQKDPIQNVRFYSKKNPQRAVQLLESEVSRILPKNFADQQIRVFYKTQDLDEVTQGKAWQIQEEKVKQAQKCVNKWKDNKFKSGNVSDHELTPKRPIRDNPPMTPVKKARKQLDM